MDSSPPSFLDRLTRNAPAEEREDEGQAEAAAPVAREVRRAEAVSFLPFPTEAITLERGLTLLKGKASTTMLVGTTSDLVPGKYEGGFKLWEAAVDLIEAVREDMRDGTLSFRRKHVLEVRCALHVLEVRCALHVLEVRCSLHVLETSLFHFSLPSIITLQISSLPCSACAAHSSSPSCSLPLLSQDSTTHLPTPVHSYSSTSPPLPFYPSSPLPSPPFPIPPCCLGAALVHFQDFNAEVLLNLTIPNLTANLAAAAAPPPRERREHKAGSGGGVGGAAGEREGVSSPCSPPVTPKSPLPDLRTCFFAGDWAAMDGLLSLSQPATSPLSLPPTAAAATDTAATDTAATDTTATDTAATDTTATGTASADTAATQAAAMDATADSASQAYPSAPASTGGSKEVKQARHSRVHIQPPPPATHMPLDGASGMPSFCASPGGTSALGHGGGRAGGGGGGYDIIMTAETVYSPRSMAKLLALVSKVRSRCCLSAAFSLDSSFSRQCAPPPLLPLPLSPHTEQQHTDEGVRFSSALDSPLR
ncbi:unnamed protein product [Closterium sp. NIES-54]